MNWFSEAALLWVPLAGQAYPSEFADRARPEANDFYYFFLDAFEAIDRQRASRPDREPWIFVVDSQKLLTPKEIDALFNDWRAQMQMLGHDRSSPAAAQKLPPPQQKLTADESYALASAVEAERDA